ncbi:MAG: hypothetical protein NWS27_05665 [Ilumatobacteraceae bacterium]|jgi:hypothetical protein|nr:hypothetical protein [Ilumatobacteraceae bacterium]MDP4713691.1 hypothetical protein [Ilumatobacteraceae bacterium]
MSTLKQRRRRQTWAAFGAGILVLTLLPVSVVVAWRAIRDSKAAEEVVALPSRELPTIPTAILAVTDEQNFLTSLNIIALTPEGAGGTVMILPVGLMVPGQPVGQPKRIADVYGSDGVDALRSAVESVTNSQIDLISVNGVDVTAELIARVGTTTPTYAADVTDTETDETRVVATAGINEFSPIQAAQVLAARDVAQVESTRIPNVKATWDAIAASIGAGIIGAIPAAVVPDVGAQTPVDMPTFMSALFAGPIKLWQFASERVNDAERNPQDIDVYGFNAGELVMVMASVAPSAMVAVFPTLSVQIDSPYADIAVTQDATFRMLYMGTNVILVRQVTSTPLPVTVIKYSDEMDRAIAEPLTTMFGEIVFEKATERVEGIDVQVILGDSFVNFLATGAKPDPNVNPEDLAANASDAPTTETTP